MNKEKAQIARRVKRTEWLMSNEVIKARNIIELMNQHQAVSLSDIARNLNMHGITTQRGRVMESKPSKIINAPN
jgi:ActR/RegA family two-component response regulator